jgi:hypothetical protein
MSQFLRFSFLRQLVIGRELDSEWVTNVDLCDLGEQYPKRAESIIVG